MNHFFFFKCRGSVVSRKFHLPVTQILHQVMTFWAVTKELGLNEEKGSWLFWKERPGRGETRTASTKQLRRPRPLSECVGRRQAAEAFHQQCRLPPSQGHVILVKLSSFKVTPPPNTVPSSGLHFSSLMGRMEEISEQIELRKF